jgi:hypothetical protein
MFTSGTVGSFVGERSNKRGGEGGKEAKRAMDGRWARGEAMTPLGALALADVTVVFSYVLWLNVLNHHHLSQPQRVLGHDGPGSRYYPHGVTYACRRPCSNLPGPMVVSAIRASCGRRLFLHAYVSRSLQKADTRVTIVSYGCTSEAIFNIARPRKLRLGRCLTAKEEEYVFSFSQCALVERGTSNPLHTRVVPLLNRNVAMCHYPQDSRISYRDFASQLCPVHARCHISRALTDSDISSLRNPFMM